MQIKLGERVAPASAAPTRPASVVSITRQPVLPTVTLSEAARALSAALNRLARTEGHDALHDVLVAADRRMLLAAYAGIDVLGWEPGQPDKLLLDLYAYRTGASQGVTYAESPPIALRLLPVLAPTEESLARAILVSSSLHEGLLDRAFVEDLLAPARGVEPRVSLAFLHGLVRAMVPDGAVDGGPESRATFARRDAYRALASAVRELVAVLGAPLEAAQPRLPTGRALLVARLLGARAGEASAASPSSVEAANTTEALEPIASQPASLARGAEALHAPAASGPTSASRVVPLLAGVRLAALGRTDRDVLALLYAAASEQSVDLRSVDAVAAALATLRRAEHAEAQRAREGVPERALPPADALPGRAPEGEHEATPPERGARDLTPTPDPAAHLRARSADAYRSFAPLPLASAASAAAQSSFAAAGRDFALAPAAPSFAAGPAARPLELAQALGVAPLLVQPRRAPPRRRRLHPEAERGEASHAQDAERSDGAAPSALHALLYRRFRALLLRARRGRARRSAAS